MYNQATSASLLPPLSYAAPSFEIEDVLVCSHLQAYRVGPREILETVPINALGFGGIRQ